MAGFLYENILRDYTILTDESVGSDIASAIDGRTGTSAEFASGATRDIIIDCAAAKTINALGISRHNLATMSCTVTVYGSSDNVSYSSLFSNTPTFDRTILAVSTNHSYRYYRIRFSGQTSNAFVCDLALGELYNLERDQKHGFISPTYADQDRVIPNITRGGNLAGMTVETGLKRINLEMFYYSQSFMNTWNEFIRSIKKYPVYLVWNADNSAQAFYCWIANRAPQPRYAKNIQNYYDIRMTLEGITE